MSILQFFRGMDPVEFLRENQQKKFIVKKFNSQQQGLQLNEVITFSDISPDRDGVVFRDETGETVFIPFPLITNQALKGYPPVIPLELMKLPELTPAEQAAETTEMLAEQAAERTEMLRKLPEKGGRRIKRRRTKRRQTKRRRTRRHRSYRK